jgi:phosphate transport system substrate-binding protein
MKKAVAPALVVLGAAGVALVAGWSSGTSTAPATPARAAGSLVGTGSTFVFPLVSKWIPEVSKAYGIDVTYSPTGSGAGIAAITARTVDFGASDAPLSADQLRGCNGCLVIPWALSATSVPYNLPGLNGRLRLNGPVLADIYLGKITAWNDPRVRALNPGRNLPSLRITPVYRSDGSGTTSNFTDYLSAVSKAWREQVGNSTSVNFPAGVGARGSSGVAGVVQKTEGALTYVDVAYSLENRLQFALVRNNAGAFATPGLRGIKAALSKLPATITRPAQLRIVNPPKAAGRLAYPIVTFTYVIVPTRSSKATALRTFVYWAVTRGQQYGPPLLFQPLPEPVQAFAYREIKKIQVT